MMSRISRLLAAIAASPIMFLAVSANAAMMNYGAFEGDTVTFVDVTEDNLGPSLLYGDFGVSTDTLLFDAAGFGALSPSPGSDLIDSELQTMIVANEGYAIATIDYAEEGDYTLVGDAMIEAGLAYFWEIVEVDGEAIIPITGSTGITFSSTSTGVGQLWEFSFAVDVEQLLTDAEVTEGEIGTNVTKMNLRFDNSLTAAAHDASSIAFVKKKQIIGLTVGSTEFIPEPTTIYSFLVGLVCLAIRRRK